MAAAAPAGKRAAADLATRLQVDFVDVCVPEGRVLSLPVESDPAGTGVEQPTLGELRARNLGRLCHEDSFFIIVDKWPARKKSVRTAGQQDFAGLRKPVAIQPLEWCPGGSQNTPHLCLSGAPRIIDFLSMGSWASIRACLLVWSQAETDGTGYMAVQGVGHLRDADLPSPPVVCLLEQLVCNGWSRGRAPAEHTQDSERTFACSNPMASREYLRCLLSLTSGALHSVLAGQPKSYYSALLSSIGASEGIPQSAADSGDVQLNSLRAEQAEAPAGNAGDSENDSGQSSGSSGYVVCSREDGSCVAGQHAKRQAAARHGTKRRGSGTADWGHVVAGCMPVQPQHVQRSGGKKRKQSTRQVTAVAASSSAPAASAAGSAKQ